MQKYQVDINEKRFRAPAANLERLAYLATLVAVEAPERPGNFTSYVRWQLINQIREELEAADYPWRDAVRYRVARERERKEQLYQEQLAESKLAEERWQQQQAEKAARLAAAEGKPS
jgi:hypothetical protein